MKPSCKRISSLLRGDETGSDLRASGSRSLLGSQLIDQWTDLGKQKTGESEVQKEVRKNLKPILRLAALQRQPYSERSIKAPLQVDFEEEEAATQKPEHDASSQLRPKPKTRYTSARLVDRSREARAGRRRGSKVSDSSFNGSATSVEVESLSKPGEIFLFVGARAMPDVHI